MKIYSLMVILALLLLSSCGSDNDETSEVVRPVDVWSPFVQVAPPGNLWYVQTSPDVEATPRPLITIHPPTRQEIMGFEIVRLYSFFAPDRALGGWIPEYHYPDFFGGIGWTDDNEYWIIYIVEGMEDEAAEFLAYVRDFQTVQIRWVYRSFNELMYVQRQIWYSGVYPELWWSHVTINPSRVVVSLFNYSDEEKRFFREFVSDSPLISFICVMEAHGENFMLSTSHYPLPLLNLLEDVTVSAQVQNDHDFVISINNEMRRGNLYFINSFLEAYMGGRWIPVHHYFFHPRRRLEHGISEISFSTAHFTRQFDGPFRYSLFFEVTGVGTHYQGRRGFEMHHITHIFSHGG